MGQLGGGWGRGLWAALCPPGTFTNAVSVFFLSLSRACTPVPTWHPGPSHAGGAGRRQAAPPVPARGGASSPPPATCPPHHRLLLPSPPGPQCLGLGEPCRDCAPPSAPHARNADAKPPPCPRRHSALRTPEAIAGPRPGRLVYSCIKLSPCPSSLHPSVSSGFFFLPSLLLLLPTLLWFSTGKMVTLPPSLPSWITSSRHVSFSFLFVCVYLSYFSSSPFSFWPSPSSAM